jgi:AcrR family transcriptional regulator
VHFDNKAECLIAAAAELIEPAVAAIAPAEHNGSPPAAKEALDGFLAVLRAQPAAARVCFVELHEVGPPGEMLGDRAFEALAATVDDVNSEQQGELAGEPELSRALLAGLRKLIHTRLGREEDAALAGLAPELWQWMASVVPPPMPLERPRRQRAAPQSQFDGYTLAERISRAVAAVVAEKGYREMSTDDIAARAAISLSTFYSHFADKRDAVLAALEMSGAQITALAVPAARRADGWEKGVKALYEAICAYFAAEPAMAELALVGVYAAGPRARRRRDRVIDSLAAMLAPGFAENPEAPRISGEAVAATVYGLLREQLRSGGAGSLVAAVPLATYITLVGFVGPERALAVANDRGQPR